MAYPVTVDGICSEIKFRVVGGQAVSFAAETTGGSPTGI